jgi:hypothetical protein
MKRWRMERSERKERIGRKGKIGNSEKIMCNIAITQSKPSKQVLVICNQTSTRNQASTRNETHTQNETHTLTSPVIL